MPTYEYACRACGHQFEEIQKMSDPAIDVCPKCGAKAAQRLISQGNFILKGGGWYTTGGYGTPSKEKLESAANKGSSSSSSSSESKGESKSETKTETKSETKTETKSEPKKDSSGSGRSSSSSSSDAA
jgi:putative FmdB family regulatory protein